ncbi:damage-inducible protein DinB [Mesorhizobium albiziae]|nr:damage-inducible protein DinB [Mesorhizobium albiziae]
MTSFPRHVWYATILFRMAKTIRMKKHFMMLAAYNHWANRRLYDAAAQLPEEDFTRDTGAFFKSMMGTLNHILVADRIWMKRFTGEGEAPAALDAIIHSDFARLKASREAEDNRIVKWINQLGDKDFGGRFTYMTMTDMRTISQRLAPALGHFFNHQTHHRGQSHMILTLLGYQSIQFDLFLFQRTEEGRDFA